MAQSVDVNGKPGRVHNVFNQQKDFRTLNLSTLHPSCGVFILTHLRPQDPRVRHLNPKLKGVYR